MPDIDLAFTSLSEAADRLDRREVSSVELTEVALERISQVDPNLNAFITILSDTAIASAREADAKRKSGERGRLLGVPLALKDLFNTAG
ncbi:MAG: amidase family protein, partial [Nitrolancea sp.]